MPPLTVFHGLRAPPISIQAYLVRIAKYAKCSPSCFVNALIYMSQLAKKDVALQPMPLNVHRLLLTSVMLSAKSLDDRYYNNAFYAKVSADRSVQKAIGLKDNFLCAACALPLFAISRTQYHALA